MKKKSKQNLLPISQEGNTTAILPRIKLPPICIKTAQEVSGKPITISLHDSKSSTKLSSGIKFSTYIAPEIRKKRFLLFLTGFVLLGLDLFFLHLSANNVTGNPYLYPGLIVLSVIPIVIIYSKYRLVKLVKMSGYIHVKGFNPEAVVKIQEYMTQPEYTTEYMSNESIVRNIISKVPGLDDFLYLVGELFNFFGAKYTAYIFLAVGACLYMSINTLYLILTGQPGQPSIMWPILGLIAVFTPFWVIFRDR